MFLKHITLIILSLSFVVLAQAKPTIYQDGDNLIVQLTLRETTSQVREESALQAVNLAQEKVAKLMKEGKLPFSLNAETLEKIGSKEELLDDFAQRLRNHLAKSKAGKKGPTFPSAFFVGAGAKLSKGVGISVEGSITFGLVVMPICSYVIPKHVVSTKDPAKLSEKQILALVKSQTKTHCDALDFDWQIFAWPNANVGAGGDLSPLPLVPGHRIMIGAIWGDMAAAKDFSGMAFGLSASAQTPLIGVKVKTGVVHNFSMPGRLQMTYLAAGYAAHLGVGVDIHLNVVSPILTGDKALGLLGFDTESIGEETGGRIAGENMPLL